MKMLQRLWKDEAGFIVSAELILVATIAVLGLVSGLATVRNSITNELADVGGAWDKLNQSYAVARVQAHSGDSTGATIFDDQVDFCDSTIDLPNQAQACVLFNGQATATNTPLAGIQSHRVSSVLATAL